MKYSEPDPVAAAKLKLLVDELIEQKIILADLLERRNELVIELSYSMPAKDIADIIGVTRSAIWKILRLYLREGKL